MKVQIPKILVLLILVSVILLKVVDICINFVWDILVSAKRFNLVVIVNIKIIDRLELRVHFNMTVVEGRYEDVDAFVYIHLSVNIILV